MQEAPCLSLIAPCLLMEGSLTTMQDHNQFVGWVPPAFGSF